MESVCRNIYIYIYIYCACVCIYIYTYIFVCLCVCVCIYIYTYMFFFVCFFIKRRLLVSMMCQFKYAEKIIRFIRSAKGTFSKNKDLIFSHKVITRFQKTWKVLHKSSVLLLWFFYYVFFLIQPLLTVNLWIIAEQSFKNSLFVFHKKYK